MKFVSKTYARLSDQGTLSLEVHMLDLAFIALGAGILIALAVYAAALDRL